MKTMYNPKVLVAGIGGASLGTELLKCLRLVGNYQIFGCDVSRYAYGHYESGFDATFVIERANYLAELLELCRRNRIDAVVPGAEQTTLILSQAADELMSRGIRLAINSPAIIKALSDKAACFQALDRLQIPQPRALVASLARDLDGVTFPCVVKPATGSGGSAFVFVASDRAEAELYVQYLTNQGRPALVQEYLPETEGEYTIGVLSLPSGRIAGAVVLRRLLEAKLSVHSRGRFGVISSPYSQGLIAEFPEVRKQAEEIACTIGSVGPLDIQGRLINGRLIPFEINPRFSGSVYFRALAGMNEPDLLLRAIITGEERKASPVKRGYYLRSLTECFVPEDELVR